MRPRLPMSSLNRTSPRRFAAAIRTTPHPILQRTADRRSILQRAPISPAATRVVAPPAKAAIAPPAARAPYRQRQRRDALPLLPARGVLFVAPAQTWPAPQVAEPVCLVVSPAALHFPQQDRRPLQVAASAGQHA